MIKLVVDMMGSDGGSATTVQAVIDFLKENDDTEFFCVGNINELNRLKDNNRVHLIASKGIIPMEAGALEALRARDSSMMVAIDTLMNERADGIISAGGTGAYLSSTTIKLKKIEGVSRPALVSPFPTKIKGKQVVVLDIGASNENSSLELVQFALMGRLYAQNVLGVNDPKVFLLSNGTESGKGSPIVKEAHSLLKNDKYFKGNIEGREALYGDADVIVCDGFTGNVFLKTCEGVAKMMSGMMKDAFRRNIFSKCGYLLAKKGFNEMKETMDYKATGGAMILGVNGVVVKAHGSSDAFAFKCALNVAYKLAKNDITKKIREGIVQNA
ncbi:MAG: phosphate acyltransferase PlsX [Bacilli bacterium]